MIELIIKWITAVAALVAIITSILTSFKMGSERKKINLELKLLKQKIEESERRIITPTWSERQKYGKFIQGIDTIVNSTIDSFIDSEIKKRSLNYFTLLVNKSLDDIRLIFDMWFAILKLVDVDKENKKDNFKGELLNAFISLEEIAIEKEVKLNYKILLEMISYDQKLPPIPNCDMDSVHMSKEGILKYLNSLNEHILKGKVNSNIIALFSQQLGFKILFECVGISESVVKDMVELPLVDDDQKHNENDIPI